MSQEFQQHSVAENSVLKNSKLNPLFYYDAKINFKKSLKIVAFVKFNATDWSATINLISLKSYATTYKPTHLEILGNEINPNAIDFKGVSSLFFKKIKY